MVALAEQVGWVAEALGVPAIALGHTARNLAAEQWPRPGSGRRVVQASPRQLLNLAVAHVGGAPMHASRTVADITSLPFHGVQGIDRHKDGSERTETALLRLPKDYDRHEYEACPIAATLGDTLTQLVEELSSPTAGTLFEKLRFFSVELELKEGKPRGTIRFETPLSQNEREAFGIISRRAEIQFLRLEDLPSAAEIEAEAWCPSVRLYTPLFRRLAEISLKIVASAPESGGAASPAREAAPTRTDRPRANAAEASNTSKNRGKKKFSQSPRKARGRSGSSLERTDHDGHP